MKSKGPKNANSLVFQPVFAYNLSIMSDCNGSTALHTLKVKLKSRYGTFQMIVFEDEHGSECVLALIAGAPGGPEAPLVRIHSQCLTGDVLGSLRCDCGRQLHIALQAIARSKCGILIYQLQEGRGIGLFNKLRAYQLQDGGLDTVEANVHLGFEPDQRTYAHCAAVLKHLGISRLRLMSNNPAKFQGLESADITVVERIPIHAEVSEEAADYMKTKREKMGHWL